MNKYNAHPTTVNSIRFDSQAEARRYQDLCTLERAGLIRDLVVHPRYRLVDGFVYGGRRERPIDYIADFEYTEDGRKIVEDVKGGRATQTAVYQVKRKLFLSKNPGVVYRIVQM